MSSRKQKPKGPFHVRLQEWMLKGPAYRALSCRARCLLVELYRYYKGEDSDTNGNLYLSVRDAAALLCCSKDAAMQAFDELEAFGFIRPAVKSAFSWKVKKATRWVLTEFRYGNRPAEKTFMDLSVAKVKEIAAALERKWGCAHPWLVQQRRLERAAEKAASRKKHGPAEKDTLSCWEGQCPAGKDSSGANCPDDKDSFGRNSAERVLPSRTEIVYQGGAPSGGAAAPAPHQHDGDPAATSTAPEPSSAASDPPSATTTSTNKGRAKKSARPRASKSTPKRRRRR